MTSSSSSGGGSRGFILAIVAVCMLGAGLIAVVISTGAGDDPDAVETTAPVTIEGDILPQMPSVGGVTNASNDDAIGQTAPRLVGTDFDGNEVVIEADGRPKAVYFVAHWCSHCQAEVPVVASLIDQGKLPEGMDVYGVSTSVNAGQGNYPPNRWLDGADGWNVTTMRDSEENEALINFGAGGFPFVVYLDGDNTVLARSAGELDSAGIEQAWALTAGGVPSGS